MEYPKHSALVEQVMKDATEQEKAEATRRWFKILHLMKEIVDEDEAKKAAEQKHPEALNDAPEALEEPIEAPEPTLPVESQPNYMKRLYRRQ